MRTSLRALGVPLTAARRGLVILVMAALLAACSGDAEPEAEPSATPSAVTTEEPTPTPEPSPEPVWPLTGLPASDGVDERPVLVVKVDNTRNARPQVGLAEADIVVEEPVEGGLTRLAAMFHSELPERVVPVRSIRTTDMGLAGPVNGVLVASGGASRVLRQMDDAGIAVLTEGTAGFSRDSSRPNLYSVTVDLAEVLAQAPERDAPDVQYLAWAAEAEPDGEAVSSAAIQFSAGHTTTHTWDGQAWTRDGDMTEPGQEFAAANLLVLQVTTRDAGYTDPGGNPVDEVVFEAGGDAVLLAGGTAIDAQWTHDTASAVFTLTVDGEPLAVPPGKTWIALVPARGGVTLS